MNYNNPYYNPYQQYPYTQPQPQTSYLPLTFINGIEGAKAFIVGANQVVYLKDSDSNILYEKKADAQGKYTLTAYELKQVEIGNNVSSTKTEYATTNDLAMLKSAFIEQMNILSAEIQKLAKSEKKEGVINE